MSAPLELSLVIPVYNERDNLPVLVEEIGRALAGRAGGEPYEIVAVDDGSTDGSLDVLKVLKREHPEIHIVALAANAGQSAAFGAGRRRLSGTGWTGGTRAGSACRAVSPMACATGSTARRSAIPAARSRRFAPRRCARCRCSTACTGSCPRSSGCRGGRSPKCPCTTGAAASGRRSTGCGTAYSAP